MLSIESLSVDLQSSPILRNITLEVPAGALVCIVGRNGAGKTTTFRSIMGDAPAKAGVIRWEGAVISGRRTHEIAARGIGWAPEESEVFGDLTVAENIEMPTWTRVTSRSASERIALAYRVFPKLLQYKTRGGTQLSGGERKMVSIARALALDPKLLLLDEPFEGLSPAIIPTISEGVGSIRALGCSILMAESNVHHLPEDVDRIYVIERGEVIFSGSLDEARRDAAVMRIMSGTAQAASA